MDLAILNDYHAARDFSSKPFRAVCYAPWTSLVFDSIGKVRACCANFEYPLGDISKERLDDIWNGVRINRFRSALKNDKLHLGCDVCYWKIRNGTFKSMDVNQSQLITLKYEPYTVEPEEPFWPKHLEFHLSNKCNLECVTCFGEFSSGIRKKREKLPPLQCHYDDQFFEDLEKFLPHLSHTQFLGGEPFIIPEMHRVWNMLIERKLTPYCHITTNGTVWGPKVEHILESLPCTIGVSMDGATKTTFEAIRRNANFERVRTNLRRFRDFSAAQNKPIFLNFTLSRLNWRELIDIALFTEDEGVTIQLLDLFSPESMSLMTLIPEDLAKVVDYWDEQIAKHRAQLTHSLGPLESKIDEFRFRLAHMDEKAVYQTRESTRLVNVPIDELIELAFAETNRQKQQNVQDQMRHETETSVIQNAPETPATNNTPLTTAPDAPANPRASSASWSVFREIPKQPTAEDAIQKLKDWNSESPIDRVDCDEEDNVIEVTADPKGIFTSKETIMGTRSADLITVLANRFGQDFKLVDFSNDPLDFARTASFTDEAGTRTLVRVFFVPRLNDQGRPFATTMLLASRRENLVPSAS